MVSVAQVYINTNQLSLDRPFDYLLPKNLEEIAFTGARVKVPFGSRNRLKEAIITKITKSENAEGLKEISSVINNEVCLDKRSVDLAFFISKKCFCSFYSSARLMIPAGVDVKFEEYVTLTGLHTSDEGKRLLERSQKQEQVVRFLEENMGSAEISVIKDEFKKSASRLVDELLKKGLVEINNREKKSVKDKTVRLAYYVGVEDPIEMAYALEKRSPVQADVLRALAYGGEYSVPDLVELTGASRNVVEALVKKGLVSYKEQETFRDPFKDKEFKRTKPLNLTDEQKKALEVINNKEKGTILLHGVTGSGKTEIYMQAIDKVLSEGKQAIVLVPEIALTPQITGRFYSRFGDCVALLHSSLSLGERLDEWKRIKRGEKRVVIGARSAIFAPCDNIGLIIIDEEHEYTYKSETMPRYHATEIAKKRAEMFNCPVVLASATPCVESYYKAKCKEYSLVELENRYNKNPLPKVSIVDMRKELEDGNRYVLSRTLAHEIQRNLENKEQTILFLNRRGYSTFVSCRSCGYVFSCPNCSVSLTYHITDNSLTCHMCGHRIKKPAICPDCGSNRIKDFGKGTQKAEEQLKEIFPTAKILRMDIDTVTGKNGHEKLLSKFVNEKYDILLGTQMVSKGHDFENVTLVGVLAADASLFSDDFRSQERTFDLITQVCGRAGRGEKEGRAIIQTYTPDDETILLASRQNYKEFFDHEIEYRKMFSYPPCMEIINIIFSSDNYDTVKRIATLATQEIRGIAKMDGIENLVIFGAKEAPVSRIQGRYRFRTWIKCENSDEMCNVIRRSPTFLTRHKDVSISIDVNPISMN